MSSRALAILESLKVVKAERERRMHDAALDQKVLALKAFQQRRFENTYADLLASDRYGAAARFFLEELYGPADFSQRDAQFERVVPALVRLFPSEIVETVAMLAELHALSESLDTMMGACMSTADVKPSNYIESWRSVGRTRDRERQISLTLEVAARLDRLTRKTLVRNSLRLMRGPAQVAGLGQLQRFLEQGFDTFKAMGGEVEFSRIIDRREHAFAAAMFDGHVAAAECAIESAPANGQD